MDQTFPAPKKKYFALNRDEDGPIQSYYQSSASPSRYIPFIFCGIAALILLAATFFAGRHFALSHQITITQSNILTPLGTVPVKFVFKESFSGPPSASSDAAWKSLFPPTNYFFENATLDGRRGAFAVFVGFHRIFSPLTRQLTLLPASTPLPGTSSTHRNSAFTNNTSATNTSRLLFRLYFGESGQA